MKTLIVALILVTITTASAQSPMLKTITIRDDSGQVLGTATTWGNITTFRDISGEVAGTITLNSDRTTTFRDADGRVADTINLNGKIIGLDKK